MGDEGDDRWEDAIDVDDSDLLLPPPFSSSFPPLRPCSQTLTPPPPAPSAAAAAPRLIPGPAGALQAQMRRRSSAAGAAAPCAVGSRSELQMRRDDPPSDLVDADDGDFALNPWLRALDSLGEGYALVSQIGSIKTWTIDRIPHVVGMVRSCTPNGLGDLFLTLKDPTGMIGAFVHRKVVSDRNLGGDISVGCVLILKQVVVFCPARAVCYLNVTIGNIVKLITKDCGPCHKQVISSFTARSHIPAKHKDTNLDQPSERDTLARRRIETGNACVEETSSSLACERMAASSKTAEVATTTASKTSHLLQKLQDPSMWNLTKSPDPFTRHLTKTLDPSTRHLRKNLSVEDSRPNLSNENVMGSKETSATAAAGLMMSNPNHEKNEPRKLISRVSVAQWTDEQLSELFADF